MENVQVVFMTEEEGGEGNLGMIALRDNRCMAFSRKGVVLTQRSSLWCSQMKHFFIFTKAKLTYQCINVLLEISYVFC